MSPVQRAPRERRKPCAYHCGATVITFADGEGLRRQLDVDPVVITVDITEPDLCHRLWEFHGPWVGWVPLSLPVRGWRPVHSEHDCPATPAARRPRRQHPTITNPLLKGHCA